ncbi:MAG: DegV family protein [Catonella sp.]|uniref:DegV family protein n=1 Tax=Catonella sp. TaxID=2382125 RepID=UPI003FA11A64
MSYLILCDSGADLTDELKAKEEVIKVPLSLMLGDEVFVDDENLDALDFLQKMKNYPDTPKSACPSPEDYLKHFEKADEVYIITISSKLSASYNSAKIAIDMYHEEKGKNKIYLIDSKGAAASQTLLANKIVELKNAGANYDETVKGVEELNAKKQTTFVLETLENLRKNGRLTGLKAFIAEALNIKPVMTTDKEGNIIKADQARGINKACALLADLTAKHAIETGSKALVISHCNCPERAEKIKAMLEEKHKFEKVDIVPTGGLATLYAAEGGIIIGC